MSGYSAHLRAHSAKWAADLAKAIDAGEAKTGDLVAGAVAFIIEHAQDYVGHSQEEIEHVKLLHEFAASNFHELSKHDATYLSLRRRFANDIPQ